MQKQSILQNKPFISFIIPVYNREHLLPRAVNSILNSGFNDFEIILIDDASTDGSADLCMKYQESDSRFKAIYLQNNRGPGYARNQGIYIATGEWIYFLDSDDELCSDGVVPVINKLKNLNNDVDIVTVNTVIANDTKSNLYYTNDAEYEIDDFFEEYPEKFACALWWFLFKREFIIKHKLYCPELYNAEDTILQLNACLYAKKMVVFSDVFHKYYPLGDDSLTKEYYNYQTTLKIHIPSYIEYCKAYVLSKQLGLNKINHACYILIRNGVLAWGLRCDIEYVPNKSESSLLITQLANENSIEKAEEIFKQLYCSFLCSLLKKPVHIIPAGRVHRILAVEIEKNGGQVAGLYDNYIGSLDGIEMEDAPNIKIYSSEKLKQLDKSISFVSMVGDLLRKTLRNQLLSYGFERGLD